MKERLQKFLAQAGIGSRRQIEEWIRAGRITVNGVLAQLGDQASDFDNIRLDGRLLRTHAVKRRVLAYNKPLGEVVSRDDPEGRPTLYEQLPSLARGRWVSVGRLDVNTLGLLLVTTDGELANRLMHPSWEIEREYAVRVLGEVTPSVLKQLKAGVELDDGLATFNTIVDAGGSGANHWYHVTLKEGRNREVKRLWESQGVTVSRLIRIRYGPISLRRGLRPGRWDELNETQIADLLTAVGMQPEDRKSVAKPSQRFRSKRRILRRGGGNRRRL